MQKYDKINIVVNVLVAQLDRVTGYEPVGRGFEPLQAHQRALLMKCSFLLCTYFFGIFTVI